MQPTLTNIDWQRKTPEGFMEAVDGQLTLGETNEVNLLNINHSVNQNNKIFGREIYVIDRGFVVYASGTAPAAVWKTKDDVVEIPPA